MKIPVKYRVDRILKKRPPFRACTHLNDLSQLEGQELPHMDGEALLGAYENRFGSKDDLVLFSDQAVHWLTGGKWHAVKYGEIVALDRPAGDKMEAAELLLTTSTGDIERLPIHGGTETTRDVYEIWRFLLRVREDLKRPDK